MKKLRLGQGTTLFLALLAVCLIVSGVLVWLSLSKAAHTPHATDSAKLEEASGQLPTVDGSPEAIEVTESTTPDEESIETSASPPSREADRPGSGPADLIAACKDNQVDKVSELLRSGIGPNTVDEKGFPALYIAAYFGHRAIVELLLREGADVNMQTPEQNTALMAASRRGDEAIVKLLLMHGALTHLRNTKGQSAVDLARDHLKLPELLVAGSAATAKSSVAMLEELARNYNETHTLSPSDRFACIDASCDLWNQIRTKGIRTGLMAGNLDKDSRQEDWIKYVREINHAWVMAEIAPNRWIAIESTNGTVVLPESSKYASYLRGEYFVNSRELRGFDELRRNLSKICQQALRLKAAYPKLIENKPYDWKLHVADAVDLRSRDCLNHLKQLYEVLQKNKNRGVPWPR